MDSDRNAPATKGDIADLRADMSAEMKAMEDRLVETMRDGQTELLKAFYSYAQGNDERVAQAEKAGESLTRRMAIMESRVTEVERRLNMPPQR